MVVLEVKQRLATILMLFDWLVTGQVIPVNPAHAVCEPKHVVKTPVRTADEIRTLLDRIPTRIGDQPEEGAEDQRPLDLIDL